MNKIEILAISGTITAAFLLWKKCMETDREHDRLTKNLRAECAELREKFAQASAARDANEAIIAQLSVALSAANGEKTVLAARLKEAA